MPLSRNATKTLIHETVRTSVVNFARARLNDEPNFQILDLLIPRERRIRSIVGGLETSMGKTLWEPLAKVLARHNDFTIRNENLFKPAIMPAALANALQAVLDDRLTTGGVYNAETSRGEFIRVCHTFIRNPIDRFVRPPRGHGVDIWIIKDGIDYFFDTKTVQPNIATIKGCLTQLLHWYAYYYSRYPTGNAQARIVFPYNPYEGDDFWERSMNDGTLTPVHEGWVENDFWDFCSGHEDTIAIIKESFTELRESGELREALESLFIERPDASNNNDDQH